MPKFKTINVDFKIAGEYMRVDVDVSINATGEFYSNVPDCAADYFEGGKIYGLVSCEARRRGGREQLFSAKFDDLCRELESGIIKAHTPEIAKENVIIYNIESHVSFYNGPNGEVLPNGYWVGREDRDVTGWADEDFMGSGKNPYGDHSATHPSKGGYSLKVGALAMTKTTETFGERKKISYSPYHKGGHHLERENPAQRLNSWCGISLNEKQCKEIPYSDEAAEFFFSLLMGMATLSKRIQEATFDQENLMKVIASGSLPMLSAPNTTTEQDRTDAYHTRVIRGDWRREYRP